MKDRELWETSPQCAICGNNDSSVQSAVDGCHIVMCRGCRTVRLLDRIRPDHLNRIYGEYYSEDPIGPEELKAQFRNPTFAYRANRLESVLSAMQRRLFEAGAGDGNFLAYMKQRGWEVAGTEYSDRSIALVRRRHGLALHNGDIIGADLPAMAYDVVAAYHVLEHVYQPREFLRAAKRLIARGGVLHIQVPNYGAISRRCSGVLGSTIVFPQHVYFYSPSTLTELLRREGFEVMNLSTYDPWHGPGVVESTIVNVLRWWITGRTPWPDKLATEVGTELSSLQPGACRGFRALNRAARAMIRPISHVAARAEALLGAGAVVDIIACPAAS